MRIVVGNRTARGMAKAKRATEVIIDEERDFEWLKHNLFDGDGVWSNHAEPGTAPAWVASDNLEIAKQLSSYCGGIEVRALDEDGPVTTVGMDGKASLADGKKVKSPNGKVLRAAQASMLALLPTHVLMLMTLADLLPQLKTNAGNDFQAKQMAGAASATAVAKWMALTANTTTPVVGDTSLTGEITTAGGGLVRYAATYAHTTGANTYTLTGTFTANGTDSLPVTIGKMGVFDASSSGNMCFATLVSPTATLSASGDVLTVTQTVTM